MCFWLAWHLKVCHLIKFMQIDSCFWQPSLTDSLVGIWVGWWKAGLVYGIITHAATWNVNCKFLTALLHVAAVAVAFSLACGRRLTLTLLHSLLLCQCDAFPSTKCFAGSKRDRTKFWLAVSFLAFLCLRWWNIWHFSITLYILLFEALKEKNWSVFCWLCFHTRHRDLW